MTQRAAMRLAGAAALGAVLAMEAANSVWAAGRPAADATAPDMVEMMDAPPPMFDMTFAYDLAARGRRKPLTLEDLRKAARGDGVHGVTGEYQHYEWANPGCGSAMGAHVGPDGLGIAITTPDDVVVRMNARGAMQCQPLSCGSAKAAEESAPPRSARAACHP